MKRQAREEDAPLAVEGTANGVPIPVAITGGSGGGGTQYTEDAPAVANPIGTAVNLIRVDTPVALVSADGDNVAQRGTNFGASYVTLLDTAGSPIAVGGGTQYTEDAPAAANPIGTAVNLIRQDTPAALVSADGDNVAQRATNFGAGYVQIVSSAGAFIDSFGGGTQYVEDVAAPADPTGTNLNMVRADVLSAVTSTDGDNISARGTNKGELYVKQTDAIQVTQGGSWAVSVNNAAGASAVNIQDGGNSITVDGTVAISGTVPVSATDLDIRNLTFATDKVDASGSTLGANSGVDIGDVTVNNAAGAAAVNIQDGGNSITVDGTVAVSSSALPTGAATSVNQTTAVTSLQLLDDVIAVLGTDTYTEAITKGSIIGVVRRDADTTLVNTTNEIAPLQVDARGALKVEAFSGETLPVSLTSTTITGTVTVDTELPAAAALADGASAAPTTPTVGNIPLLMNATTVDRQRAVVNALNSTGTGIAAAGLVGQLDDTTPGTVTENQFAPVRISATRSLHSTIRDATGEIGANVLDLTNSNPLTVAIVDGSGTQITSFGGGTQYTEDIAAAADPIGTAQILVRQDTPAGLVTTDGDNLVQRGTNFGAAYCQIVSSAGAFVDTFGGGTQYTEDVAAAADPIGTAVNLIRQDTPATITSANGDNVAQRGTNYGAAYFTAIDTSGNPVFGTQVAGGGDGLTGSVTGTPVAGFSYVYSATSNNWNRQQQIEFATNDGPTGIPACGLVAQFDDAGPTAISEDLFGNCRISTNRNLYTTIRDAAGNERGVNVNATNQLSTAAAGDVAHDAANAGNPLQGGGVAVSGSATPTSVASGDRTRWIFNQAGIPYVIGGHPNIITREYDFGTAAQTDVNLAAAVVAADERIYVTRFEALCDNANTVAVSVRAGFGTASVPTASATGVSGMIASHPGIAAGSGIIIGGGGGIIAVGGAGEEPRVTSTAATTGNLHVVISYFLIDETP